MVPDGQIYGFSERGLVVQNELSCGQYGAVYTRDQCKYGISAGYNLDVFFELALQSSPVHA